MRRLAAASRATRLKNYVLVPYEGHDNFDGNQHNYDDFQQLDAECRRLVAYDLVRSFHDIERGTDALFPLTK